MFVGKDFVLKHIRVKHAEKVDEYKNKVGHQFTANMPAQMKLHLSVSLSWPFHSCLCTVVF